jgi:hypothetical protein
MSLTDAYFAQVVDGLIVSGEGNDAGKNKLTRA